MVLKKSSIIFMLAWRNVWKNKRRSIITLMAVILGSMMIIFMNALQKGGQDQMIKDAVSTNTGHIQIHEKGFWDNMGIDYAFISPDLLIRKLKKMEQDKKIKGFSRRLHAGCLLSFKKKTTGGSIQAVDPENEKKVSIIQSKILKGRYLNSSDKKNILIGKELAEYLKASVGDTISMLSQGFDGSIAAGNLSVVGIFNTGNPELDRYLIIMPIDQAMDTFTMMGYINSIVIGLEQLEDIKQTKEAINSYINREKIEVMGYDELMPDLMQHLEMDRFPVFIFNFILLVIVASSILNTIQMSVFERIREFGVMMAIGTRPGQVRAMILCESFIITCIGVIIGLVLGCLASYYFILNPIDYSGYGEEVALQGISSTFSYSPEITARNLLLTTAIIFISSLLFSCLPAWKASRLKPIEAIRHL